MVLLGLLMVCINTILHGAILGGCFIAHEHIKSHHPPKSRLFAVFVSLSLPTLIIMTAHLLGVAVWACLLIWLGAFTDLATASYFSLVAYTTLGFGDITLPAPWQVLSGLIAANGFIGFGLSTAFQAEFLTDLRKQLSRPRWSKDEI